MLAFRYRTLVPFFAGATLMIAAGFVFQAWGADAAPGGGAALLDEGVTSAKRRVEPPASPAVGDYSFIEAPPDDAGPPSEFVPIPAYRMYDSRLSGEVRWVVGDDFLIPALTDTDLVEQVPDEATALAFNVTLADAQGAGGYVQIYGPGVAAFSTSTVNWSPPIVFIANSGSSEVGTFENTPGWMGVAMGGAPGSSAHIIIDITGYYQPTGFNLL